MLWLNYSYEQCPSVFLGCEVWPRCRINSSKYRHPLKRIVEVNHRQFTIEHTLTSVYKWADCQRPHDHATNHLNSGKQEANKVLVPNQSQWKKRTQFSTLPNVEWTLYSSTVALTALTLLKTPTQEQSATLQTSQNVLTARSLTLKSPRINKNLPTAKVRKPLSATKKL